MKTFAPLILILPPRSREAGDAPASYNSAQGSMQKVTIVCLQSANVTETSVKSQAKTKRLANNLLQQVSENEELFMHPALTLSP